ncbi:sensor domain-containing diguanylate cyclase [uncultured Desulfovibrio sp.]|uniref:sensor domain-containing diguanylate cyclase n=1 Tax=uncultured Desulfovibrio sp. TaxID=167968 RepID=UPI002614E191|nr:sensor domain-containing diguanylate cyclase [uncultured Desulfovibrio sp.]
MRTYIFMQLTLFSLCFLWAGEACCALSADANAAASCYAQAAKTEAGALPDGMTAHAADAVDEAGIDHLVSHHGFLLTLEVILILVILGLLSYVLRLRRVSLRRIRAGDQRFAHITNNINGGVIRLSPSGSLPILDANSGFWDMLGYTDSRTRTENLADLLQHGDAALLLHKLQNAGDNVVSMELSLRRADKAWLPLLLRGTLGSTAGGQPVLDCVILDIADQRLMREELEQEKERYRLILEQSQDIIFDVDMEKRQFQCSSNFRRKFGDDAIPGFDANGEFNARRVIHPDDLPAFREVWRRILANDPTAFAVVRMPTAEGRYIWCRIQTARVSKPGMPLRLVGKIVDIDESVRQRAQLERLSQRDSLTDLLNKTAFNEKVKSCLPARPQQDRTDALIFLDLDNFKTLNDTLGHIRGDEALTKTAEIIKGIFRNADAVGRFGGDEFCVFVRGITREALRERAEALRSGLHMFFEEGDITVEVTSSIGIYLFDGAEPSYEVALERADTAQYHAKQSNKNAFRFYDEVVDAWDENFTTAPENAQPDMATASTVTGAPAPQAAR